ncbi:peptide/nickel transport system permease protein [Streptosporangium lutulentum]|uniref:Peptide/nickel transport system permease protein n=1 Tax=Streptosporangium lutulentum TaxID=1461250 RepID=A0ABT9Q2X6_9ACTN|nr:ABC transporter permease [Streptosporangium lutulentum]MDP9840800.1 peptide/nickel transport system permease protein [Streptosporangium lutulentum]
MPDNASDSQGMAIVARTQGQMVRRRFFRHRAALAGMILFGLIIILAFSSIGFAGIPGWWDKTYLDTGALTNQGRPTLSLIPEFLGGAGMHLGEHPFGQDDIGIDYFALTMRGAQQSIIIAFVVGIVATFFGTVVGSVAGYFRGRLEALLMRLTDVMITIPVLIIAAVVGRMMGDSGALVLGLFLGLVTWPTLSRLVRGEFLSLREKEFVEAARAIGTSPRRIIFRHILPNTVGVIIVSATLGIASAVLLESALSFLGLGIQAPDTSLGQLISRYRSAMVVRPWLFWWPGMFIIAIALSINFIGDGLRDAFDPRQTRVRA